MTKKMTNMNFDELAQGAFATAKAHGWHDEKLPDEHEIWKDIKGYEGLYKISNFGRIIRLQYIRRNILTKRVSIYKLHFIKPILQKGYLSCSLSKNGVIKRFRLHRLIAINFIPNPNGYKVVNHIDGNKINNSLKNLEWCTIADNNRHAYRTGLNKGSYGMKGKKGSLCKLSKSVCQYNINGDLIAEYDSVATASECTGAKKSSISRCARGFLKKHKGFIWRYKHGNKKY